MAFVPRYLERQIERDLSRKMVFVPGPRQVGKTTLARKLIKDESGYLNWDVRSAPGNDFEGRTAADRPLGVR